MVKEIPLTQGKVALVDDEDYERINQYKWHAHERKSGGYYARRLSIGIYMHRFIMNAKQGEEVDHINGNTLDNRKCNLRMVTHAQNGRNRRKCKGKSKYKGVYWNKDINKWMSYITFNYKHIYLGLFIDEDEAGRAYDEAAKKYFGEYAGLNLS